MQRAPHTQNDYYNYASVKLIPNNPPWGSIQKTGEKGGAASWKKAEEAAPQRRSSESQCLHTPSPSGTC